MKRIFALYISFAMLLSGCGSTEGTAGPAGSLPSSGEPDVSASEPQDTAVPAEPNSEAPSGDQEGDTVKFGGYDWIILDRRDDKALLLTKSIIALKFGNITSEAQEAMQELEAETMPEYQWDLDFFNGFSAFDPKYDGPYDAYSDYRDKHPDIFNDDVWYTTWEACSLREWLNSEMDFTDDEWDRIETTEVVDKTGLGANTSDKVFLLDMDDVEKYFPRNEDRATDCKVSDEELLKFLKDWTLLGALSGEDCEMALASVDGGDYYWWVRSAEAGDSRYLKPMANDEMLGSIAPYLGKPLGIRPAIWISLDGL